MAHRMIGHDKAWINVAIIGCGRISGKHARAIAAHPRARLKIACDIDQGRAIRLAEEYKIPMFCTDYDWVLAQEEIDLVHICTPSYLHVTDTLLAARARKHVLVEKPQAMNLKMARLAISECEKYGVKLGVILQNRWNPPVKDLIKIVQRGLLGKILMVSAVVRWYRPQEYYDDDWHGDLEMSGGVILNQAMHHVDLLRLLGGPVKSVEAYEGTLGHDIKSPDTCVAALLYESGALGTLEATTCAYPRNAEGSITVIGTRGTLKAGGTALNLWEMWRVEGALNEEHEMMNRQAIDPPGVYGQGHIDQIADMIDAIIDDRAPAIGGREALKALELALQITGSASNASKLRTETP